MMSFKEFMAKQEATEKLLLEYECYQLIPGTRNSYRQDKINTSTQTQKHSHIYAKPKGSGKELYAVNIDGSGHDGASGKKIPDDHANYFRSIGYSILPSNILEWISIRNVTPQAHALLLG